MRFSGDEVRAYRGYYSIYSVCHTKYMKKEEIFLFCQFLLRFAINQLFRFRVRFNLWNCGKQLRKARENIWTWVVSHVNPGKVIEILSKKCYKWKSSSFYIECKLRCSSIKCFFQTMDDFVTILWKTTQLFTRKYSN